MVCQLSVKSQHFQGFLWLDQSLLANCGNMDTAVGVCYRLQEVRLLFCLSTFLRLKQTLHLFLSVCNKSQRRKSPQVTVTVHSLGKYARDVYQHFFNRNTRMCVFIFLHRLWVNKCGFIISTNSSQRGKREEV